ISQCISRGKVEVYVSIHKINDDSKEIRLNRTLAESYISTLRELSSFGLDDDLSLSALAVFSDIFEVEYKEIDEKAITEMVSEALGQALDGFLKMREDEGLRLKSSILEHLNALEAQVSLVEKLSPQTAVEYRERLEKRLRETLSGLNITADESRLLTEVAIFSDKVSVDEETVRLKSHIVEFRTALDADAPIGKKLDFIIQEMNREANTIGSKCNDIKLSKCVVEIKSIIEKIREQIQNIE
ncbi:MAG TPA: YicC family protein, partial [Candidatus Monoglobus merdigallinarum]|nr:YicC family protein [Candidatus Monoglobus merdigallinarum]